MYNVIIDYGTDSLKLQQRFVRTTASFQLIPDGFSGYSYTVDSHLITLSIEILLPNYNLLIYLYSCTCRS